MRGSLVLRLLVYVVSLVCWTRISRVDVFSVRADIVYSSFWAV
jgi:hypothetical protein